MKLPHLILIAGAACALGSCRAGSAERLPLPTELSVRNQDIEFYARRVAQDPASAADLAQLAGLFLQRARESGDYEDFRRAEAAARKSWELRDQRNGKALHLLASALLAQHKFEEARRVAEQLVQLDPDVVSWRALLAEIQLELGDYNAADRTFAGLQHARGDLSVAPRLARYYELKGRSVEAKKLLVAARNVAMTRMDLPREQQAWFFLRVADFELRHRALRAAKRQAQAGLLVNPGDVRLIATLARVEFEQGNWKRVMELLEPIVADADIASLSMLGDAYLKTGGKALADNVFAEIEARAAANPEPFNRQWTQFRLDHRRELTETVAILEHEARLRPDVLGLTMLAEGRRLLAEERGRVGRAGAAE